MNEATLPIDAARVELLLNELRLPGVKAIWPKIAAQSDKEGWPTAFLIAKAGEPTIDRPSRREVVGQQSPRGPPAQNLEDRIHDLPDRPRPRPPDRTGQWKKAESQSPFGIWLVWCRLETRVCCARVTGIHTAISKETENSIIYQDFSHSASVEAASSSSARYSKSLCNRLPTIWTARRISNT